MTPMSRKVHGLILSAMLTLSAAVPVAVHAESVGSLPHGFGLRVGSQTDLQAWKPRPVRGDDMTQPAPRGNLRDDIASNAHAQPSPVRDVRNSNARRH